jgi:outer membrane lipoprotein
MSSIWKPLLAASAALALGACATVPKPLEGNFTQLQPTQVAKSGTTGTNVRWGGQIISTEPGAQATCFFVLARPLDSTARPRIYANGAGRFVACHGGFYDPEVFTRGREITFTGTLDGSMVRKVGKYDYTYPRIQASTVYLWPRRPRPIPMRDPFYDPFWGPYYYNSWYSPYWYAPPPVIVVRPPHVRHH